MPSRTSVAQQSGVDPPQSEGPTQAIVSSAAHEVLQAGVSVVRSAQQTCEPGQATAGHVPPASLEPPLLPVLPLPLLLDAPLDEPLDASVGPPLDPPPDEELLVLASPPPLPSDELLPPHPVHGAAHARTRVAARETQGRPCMAIDATGVETGGRC